MDPELVAGRFKLVTYIERGGMGEVYRAEDTRADPASADRTVAVKRILRGRWGVSVDPHGTQAKRFTREIAIMRRLDHPNIPRVIDGGVDPDTAVPYLAMELLCGHTLRDLSAEEPQLPVSWVAAIGAQISDALGAAHTEGVVHRDLKPANVMLVRGGRAMVLDFGTGRVIDDTATPITSADKTIGTARYMAPEQFSGSDVTEAADLYALGCVLFELLVGGPPFTASDDAELARAHTEYPVPPLRLMRADLPVPMERLIRSLLDKDPTERPSSAAEARDTLLRFADGADHLPGWADYTPPAALPSTVPAPRPEPTTDPATPTGRMDVFALHDRLIEDYREFTQSGTVIRDERVREHLQEDAEAKSQWPDPWVSLNPFFASGGTVPDLVAEGILHPECAHIFTQDKPAEPTARGGRRMTLHRHQREAIETARSGASYVLTTGTGSGKSLAYLVPIVDRVLRVREEHGTNAGNRVRAIIVYPMNALANSQLNELEKFLTYGYGPGHEKVTYARYTGQEDDVTRRRLQEDPPDILLTNYVMLELMLTRPDERTSLIRMAAGLEFLVFDELHTYRGRQGADVALLIRRVREACQAPNLQCVGTSATMASQGEYDDQQSAVADVASTIFGTSVAPEHVITETLVRATEDAPENLPAERITQEPPRSYDGLHTDPLARWVESRFGLDTDSTGRLVRSRPGRVEDAAHELATQTGHDSKTCAAAIRTTLDAGAEATHPVTERPLFAFRLHQFLSKGDTVYATLEHPERRYLTREYQLEQPGSGGKILLPMAFCRDCGQEYLTVWRDEKAGSAVYTPRPDTVAGAGGAQDGFLYVAPSDPWPDDVTEIIEQRKLPESWLEVDEHGNDRVKPTFQDRLPRPVTVDPYGVEGRGELKAAFVPAPFRFCLRCGVSDERVRGKDFAYLATLSQEGRSSATSLISASIVRALTSLPSEALRDEARKLLTFVDNRQDASLQAGHFNDFVQVTQLRGALHRALVESGDGLNHDDLAERVADALEVGPEDYAKNPEAGPKQLQRAAATLRDVIAFRLYCDLERGWRVTMPNLEQTGLLRIDYEDLDWLAENEQVWEKHAGPELQAADADTRAEVLRVLLDEMRRALAIDVRYFREDFDTLRRASGQHLTEPWQLTEGDEPRVAVAYPHPSTRGADHRGLYLSGRGKFGRYLQRHPYFKTRDLSVNDRQHVIADLLKVAVAGGLAVEVESAARRGGRRRAPASTGTTGYRVNAGALLWLAADGTRGAHDPLTRTYAAGSGPRVNPFFRDLYRDTAHQLIGLRAQEHTAQVEQPRREQREKEFAEATLRLMYCSPTMELGVDIASLNAVLMRNVPPTPANYAQRSGRAGRSGQPALVTTYCATGNSHDQYYFRNSEKMVSGVVRPPRLDLTNEDLLAAHVQAVWLAETGVALGRAVPEVIDIAHDETAQVPDPALPLRDSVREKIAATEARRRAAEAARVVLEEALGDDTSKYPVWWDDSWLQRRIERAPAAFDRAFDRWRALYRAALVDREAQHRRILDTTLSQNDRTAAERRRREAETQLTLLKNETRDAGSLLADFNPYRYLASEGFLPGYSFPRLPLAAYIPAPVNRPGEGDYLQRPRFLAIREFGPGALIYHEGDRYQVTRVQLPPDSSGDVHTGEATRCESCGYLHEPEDRADRCELCGGGLGAATYGLLHLHTVYTRRREKISSDEEERRRSGFRLVTSYRFQRHGDREGRQDARVTDGDGTVATLSYGDSATVRVANLGRLRAKENEPDGFWLDPASGRWLTEREATQAAGDSSEMPAADEGRKKRVIPYVEDRRNILVVRLAEALPHTAALSLMYALERGIEAAFELEDAELTSELLPGMNAPSDHTPRDRMLFTEAAEGGAGVLRRLQFEPDRLAEAARTALAICHFDPEGNDTREAGCARGCYDCLLTYGNQTYHQRIDRRAVRAPLLRLADSITESTGIDESRTGQMRRLVDHADTRLEGRFVAWLKDHGYRMPDDQQVYIPQARARPDFLYRLPGATVAVFVDGPVHEHADVAERDAHAEDRLIDAGLDVVRIPHDVDWREIVAAHPTYFGVGRGE